jgi:hypothetical protein
MERVRGPDFLPREERMEKVRLEIDELRLQSFTTSDDPTQLRGTVNGYENPTDEVEGTAFDTCACITGDCTAICQADTYGDDEYTQWLRYAATFIGSGT